MGGDAPVPHRIRSMSDIDTFFGPFGHFGRHNGLAKFGVGGVGIECRWFDRGDARQERRDGRRRRQ